VKATTLALIGDKIAIVGLTSTGSGSGGDNNAAYVIFPFLFSKLGLHLSRKLSLL
jgi:hypothetical protein